MGHARLTPEARLVFRTAASAIPADELDSLLRAITDWTRLFAIADRQVALLALWRALKAHPTALTQVPADFAEALRRVALVEDLRMQQLAKRAQQTVAACTAAQVPVLLLKGAAIGALCDPSFRSRPMTDVDLLVAREDVPRAQEAILGAGWKLTDNPVYLELLQDAHHLPHFVDALQPGVRLELHVALMPDDQPFGITEASFWQSAYHPAAPFEGALVPAPAQMMLHAAVHYAWQHTLRFGAWRTFRMVHLISTLPGFDWDACVREAQRVKAGTTLYWTLRLGVASGGLDAPREVLRALAPPTPELVRAALERHYIALNVPGEAPESPSIRLNRYLWYAALRPRWSGHANPGRYDPERKWDNAYGKYTETAAEKLTRHLRTIGNWTRFVRATLLGS